MNTQSLDLNKMGLSSICENDMTTTNGGNLEDGFWGGLSVIVAASYVFNPFYVIGTSNPALAGANQGKAIVNTFR